MRCSHCGRTYPAIYAKIMRAFEEAKQPLGQYQLGKTLGSYRQVLRILHQLEAAKYIEIDHLEPSKKRGKRKIYWRRKL